MNFNDLNIISQISQALEKEKYEIPTPIQELAIPLILEGRDLLGSAQTGTGKTAAYAIPTIQLLCENIPTSNKKIRALVLTPTRELAQQVFESFKTYGQFTKLKYSVIYGGVSQSRQEEKLKAGVDIVIATPGRLNDLMNQKRIDLKHVEILVLDEADRMLDMGFIVDVKKIIEAMPNKKQTLLFSATMPKEIVELSSSIMVDPAEVSLIPKDNVIKTINQKVYYVSKSNKLSLLIDILKNEPVNSALIFTRTKMGADRLAQNLLKENISAIAIHGDKTQFNRQQALTKFKKGLVKVLVATDVASRGIDIDELSHVINFDVPEEAETYIHRIGRTGRAGLNGTAITMCDISEKYHFKSIETLIGMKITEVTDHPYMIKPKVVSPKAVKDITKSYSRPKRDIGKNRDHHKKSVDSKPSEIINLTDVSEKNVKSEKTERTERQFGKDRSERNGKSDRARRTDKTMKFDNAERQDRSSGLDRKERSERTEKSDRKVRFDRSEKPFRSEKSDRSPRYERQDRSERPERSQRSERPNRYDREERSERPARFERDERNERPSRFEKSDRPSRLDRKERSERPERSQRSGRPNRFDRDERTARPARFEKSDRSSKFERKDRFEKPAKSDRASSFGKEERTDRSSRSEKSKRFDKPAKFGKSERTERPIKSERSRKPAKDKFSSNKSKHNRYED